MKSKLLCGAVAASVVVLQSHAALANCDGLSINGVYNVVGSLNFTDGTHDTFYCPVLRLQAGTGANKNRYSISPTGNCVIHDANSGVSATLSATNSIIINPTTCRMTGAFVYFFGGRMRQRSSQVPCRLRRETPKPRLLSSSPGPSLTHKSLEC